MSGYRKAVRVQGYGEDMIPSDMLLATLLQEVQLRSLLARTTTSPFLGDELLEQVAGLRPEVRRLLDALAAVRREPEHRDTSAPRRRPSASARSRRRFETGAETGSGGEWIVDVESVERLVGRPTF